LAVVLRTMRPRLSRAQEVHFVVVRDADRGFAFAVRVDCDVELRVEVDRLSEEDPRASANGERRATTSRPENNAVHLDLEGWYHVA
jgi:hypothetical protein